MMILPLKRFQSPVRSNGWVRVGSLQMADHQKRSYGMTSARVEGRLSTLEVAARASF